jgi:protein SCO1
MSSLVSKSSKTIGIGLVLLVLLLALAFVTAGLRSRAVRMARLPDYGAVPEFTLTNQLGQAVTLGDFLGHTWIADIIFTRCPGPCLRMTRQMKELQEAMRAEDRVKLVSLTTDPDFDSPSVLKIYGARFGTDPNRWTFLTGTKREIGNLASGGLKLSAVEKNVSERDSADDLFIHSTVFVVVDGRGHLRGIFETGGEGVDWATEKRRILSAVRQLELAP